MKFSRLWFSTKIDMSWFSQAIFFYKNPNLLKLLYQISNEIRGKANLTTWIQHSCYDFGITFKPGWFVSIWCAGGVSCAYTAFNKLGLSSFLWLRLKIFFDVSYIVFIFDFQNTESEMSAYGYSYEPTAAAAAASGYLSGGRGPSSFGNPASYGMPGSAFGSPYGSSPQPGSMHNINGISASVSSGMSPVSLSSHHTHTMQSSGPGYSTAPHHLGSGSGAFHGFSSAYGPTAHSSYGSLMNQYQNCSPLTEAVLHQGA